MQYRLCFFILLSGFLFGQQGELPAFPGIHKVQGHLLAMLVSDAGAKDGARYRIQVSLTAPQAKHHYQYGTSESRAVVQADVARMQDLVLPKLNPNDTKVITTYGVIFGFSATSNRAGIEALAGMREVTHIDAMPIYRKRQTRPGDREGFPIVNLDAVHDAGFTGEGVTIAIIDDGIDISHPAFAGKILGGFDFGDNDPDFNWDQTECPDQTHGTAVAGVAAGKGGNILGTAPDAKIVFYKVGSATECFGLIGDVAAAVDMAVQQKDMFGIKVLNMSFGENTFIDQVGDCEQSIGAAELQAYQAAHAAGIVMFASAGNEASCDGIIAPACLSEIISVGSVYDSDIGGDANCYTQQTCVAQPDADCPQEAPFYAEAETAADRVALYSNSGSLLDILAPSENALTALAGGGEEPAFGGTSSASPFAAGVGALLIAANGKDPGKDQVLAWLRDTGVSRTDAKNNLARPRIDAQAAVTQAMGDPDTGNPTEPDPITLTQRWIAHITPTAGFVTSIQVTNRETTEQSFTLTPFESDGSALPPVSRNAPASTTTFYSLTDLFGGAAVSHLRIGNGDKVTVSVAYRSANGGSPAQAGERGTHGNKWRLMPGAWDVVFDGFAAVNLGNQATDVMVTQKAADGSTIASNTPITGLAPNAKGLFLLNNDFTETANAYFDVTASQALALIAIRFEKPAFTFLWENLAILLTTAP